MAAREGQRIDTYRLMHHVGTGTFSDVYQGEHIHYREQVAIKVITWPISAENREAFLTNYRAQQLHHPHILGVQHMQVNNEGEICIVMEYAPQQMRQLHPLGHRLDLDSICLYTQQLAIALQYAHEQGIRHGDIRPQNMHKTYDERLCLSDFGLDVLLHTEDALNTQLLNTAVGYLAPEQLRGEPTFASDQYSLAAVIYEWLSGVPLFQGSQWEIVAQHLMDNPLPLRTHIPRLNPRVEAVVLRALAKDPADRFPNVLAFAMALEQARQQNMDMFTTQVHLPKLSLEQIKQHLRQHLQQQNVQSRELPPLYPDSQPLLDASESYEPATINSEPLVRMTPQLTLPQKPSSFSPRNWLHIHTHPLSLTKSKELTSTFEATTPALSLHDTQAYQSAHIGNEIEKIAMVLLVFILIVSMAIIFYMLNM